MPESKTVKKINRCPNGTRKNKKTGKCESVLDNTCAICLDRIVTNNVKTKCKHNFHKGCLIGWCKNNPNKPTCPVCRSDITDICKKIMPFDSQEIFRYVGLNLEDGLPHDTKKYFLEQIDRIIHNKNFDINVKSDPWNRSILYELTHDTQHANTVLKKHIEYLLKQPNIKVSNELIQSFIARNNTAMIALFKKHKKIPKALKGLI